MMTQIHGEGSAIAYGRRYLTCMIFNIPTGDDDDGVAGGGIEHISKAQISEIKKLIKEREADQALFLTFIKSESIETIPVKDFDNAVFDHFGVESRFYLRDGKYYVHTQGTGGKPGPKDAPASASPVDVDTPKR